MKLFVKLSKSAVTKVVYLWYIFNLLEIVLNIRTLEQRLKKYLC